MKTLFTLLLVFLHLRCSEMFKATTSSIVGLDTSNGKMCHNTSECEKYMNNTICKWYFCHCKDGYYEDRTRHTCIEYKAVPIGGNCTMSRQCELRTEHAYCGHSHCKCRYRYRYNNITKTCVRKVSVRVLLTFACSSDQQCLNSDPRTRCLNKVCSCKSQYEKMLGTLKCSRYAKLQQACEKYYDCPGHAHTCSNGVCACKVGYKAVGEACKLNPHAALGESCKFNVQCFQATEHSHCIFNRCKCKSSYIAHQLDGKLVCGRQVNLGDACSKYDILNNTDCVNGFSDCKPGYKKVDDYCIHEYSSRSVVQMCMYFAVGILGVLTFVVIAVYIRFVRHSRKYKINL